MTFNLLVVGELISVFGIAANVINNQVFYKLGFQESVDITLTALSVSDLGALITIQLANVMVNPWCLAADVPFVPIDFLNLVSFYPHSYLIRVNNKDSLVQISLDLGSCGVSLTKGELVEVKR
ncbi:platelet-activating factor receptor [Biomphalaria glabrata]|nr:platelet-activating factor receptor [Biomphalaria glabrata]